MFRIERNEATLLLDDGAAGQSRRREGWTNMAPLDLWCEQKDERQRLWNPDLVHLSRYSLVLSHLSLLLSSLDHPFFWPINPSHPFQFHLHRKKNSPASSPPGGSSAAWWRSKRSLRAPSGPPAVSAGTSRIGESQPPAARPPPCPGTAGSYATPGWWRHPTENDHKNTMKAAVWRGAWGEKKQMNASNRHKDLCCGWTGDRGRGGGRFTTTSPVCCSLRTKLSVSVSGPASRRRNSGCSPSASLHT